MLCNIGSHVIWRSVIFPIVNIIADNYVQVFILAVVCSCISAFQLLYKYIVYMYVGICRCMYKYIVLH